MKKWFINYDGDMVDDGFCKNELLFWYMLVIYLFLDIFIYVSNYMKYDYVWKLMDNNGVILFYYVCCNFCLKVEFFFMLVLYMLDEIFNGLIFFYVVVQCLYVVLIYIFMKIKYFLVDIKDYNNKNILYYFVMNVVDDVQLLDIFLFDVINKSYDKLISE